MGNNERYNFNLWSMPSTQTQAPNAQYYAQDVPEEETSRILRQLMGFEPSYHTGMWRCFMCSLQSFSNGQNREATFHSIGIKRAWVSHKAKLYDKHDSKTTFIHLPGYAGHAYTFPLLEVWSPWNRHGARDNLIFRILLCSSGHEARRFLFLLRLEVLAPTSVYNHRVDRTSLPVLLDWIPEDHGKAIFDSEKIQPGFHEILPTIYVLLLRSQSTRFSTKKRSPFL